MYEQMMETLLETMKEIYVATECHSTAILTIAVNYCGYGDMVELDLEFAGHRWYGYDVPSAVALGILNADSKGGYYHRHIRGKYKGMRLD